MTAPPETCVPAWKKSPQLQALEVSRHLTNREATSCTAPSIMLSVVVSDKENSSLRTHGISGNWSLDGATFLGK
eukprot:738247-Amphidinium_carterae.1